MIAGEDATKDSKATATTAALPQYPGEDFLAHSGTQWVEQSETILAARGLLAVAQGQPSPKAECIIDQDLATLPSLPLTHRDHYRREETRSKVMMQNEVNTRKRFQIEMEAWTDIYTLVKAATEKTAPVFSRELKSLCDLAKTHGVTGGYTGPTICRIIRE